MTTYYKIRDKNTGLYSPGGSDAIYGTGWKKGGKVWQGLGPLKNHLRLFTPVEWRDGQRVETNKIPDHWEVVELEVVTKETGTYLAKELIK